MIVAALLVPAVVGLALLIGRARVSGPVAAWLGAAAMTVSLVLYALVWEGRDVVSGEVDEPWIEPIGARLHLGVTAISWPFLLMTAGLGVLCCLWLVARDSAPALVGLVLVISASSLGVFSSLDLLVFFVFFELALVPMWFVIAWWGDVTHGAQTAATRFLLFTVSGSGLILVGIVVIGLDGGSLQVDEAMSGSLAAAVLVTIGFAVKTPVVPLHTWLPDAHSAAPTVGSVLLAGVFLKLGTYGLILFSPLLTRFADVAPYLAVAGAIGVVWAALACYAQDDLKRLIAYSSIGHMGFVVIAISTQSRVGLAAAVIGSVAHGVISALLFFTAGSLKDRFGTASMAAIGRGLYARTPWLAVTFVLAAVAGLGLPGLAAFWGEVLSLRAAYEIGDVLTRPVAWTALGLAVLGIALTTAYFVRAVRLLAQGEPVPHAGDRDLDRRELVVLGTLVVAALVLGLWPDPVLDLFDPLTRSFAR
ncbi:complex I subunit 4 family protein [Aeromicrobium chenweiae]|uniref:NADH-quinone oxidoreductase subunit M n=1 Tax=Aeromicrobium chenweiae TaxID=2079793 RepID=A0A2S0WQG4_9ACTN|nr:NADH-quinone oxidoreductase subunit M [Aeromicrobium chenweiae]AWB93498.1 NADH-quinone oxidoreductase subunit M [Aeromicrobium chenweiae]TGN34491.1 NADH-quinone oxidoreductase subunit M [Aeromicrobium chenweiae]